MYNYEHQRESYSKWCQNDILALTQRQGEERGEQDRGGHLLLRRQTRSFLIYNDAERNTGLTCVPTLCKKKKKNKKKNSSGDMIIDQQATQEGARRPP